MTNTTNIETAEYYELRLDGEVRTYPEYDWDDAADVARITGAELTVVTINYRTGAEISRKILEMVGGW